MAHDDRHHEHGRGRTCRRTGCNRPAVASLSFRYETRQVWVTPLGDEGAGNRYDLCAHHADSLTVPKGWHRVDERSAPRRAPRAHGRGTGSPARSRQASSRQRSQESVPGPPAASPAAGAEEPCLPAVPDRYARLLSELPRLAAETAPTAGRDAGASSPALQAEMLGQLTIPVGDRTSAGAVVVSLEQLVGARRRAERDSLRT